jgi:histone H3/H4
MSEVEHAELKQVVKAAIKEALVENQDLIKEVLAELMEDAALLERMEEGRKTEFVSRDEIMDLLEPRS